MPYKTLVILAKSFKGGGYCLAGRELLTTSKPTVGSWIRPVSNTQRGEIHEHHFHLTGTESINVLDVVRVPVLDNKPIPGQPENMQILESMRWQRIGRLPGSLVDVCVEHPPHLWHHAGSSADILPAAFDGADFVSQSLYLIKPQNLHIRLSHGWNDFKGDFERRIFALFDYNGQSYCLSVTDPKVRRMLNGQYPGQGMPAKTVTLRKGDHYYLCVSLGPRFGHHLNHYKFVATIFDYDGYLQEHYH